MKRLFNKICNSGKIDIQVDYHKLFNETAEQAIFANEKEYRDFDIEKMIKTNRIIRVEFFPSTKRMTALAYSHDLEDALQNVYNQYLLFTEE